MDDIGFSNWLKRNGVNGKVCSDISSRLRRIEKEMSPCDIDEEYRRDRCGRLLFLFSNKGENDVMRGLDVGSFPIGTYQMNSFRHALRKYIQFKKSLSTPEKTFPKLVPDAFA